ncbi:uncharacterized protein Eint_020515 [Encephalitozoon intestinalis ATCC 50506]|uniref:Uncharacterized protein n=1 Tax=Encephalitozoon intestinalis (strain ATCC 50506) TaxID=876142 RepID=W8P963_ENCIT|nr:uncharacterized protein Eint_020515 [Encephalitozoon intestinalis ATCC 50506]AHL30077.1 hypothetical protein Eint_020515 [Encephalitozoon intestinalis ATCC 50506]UTX44700.1 hypothetical protein GPK93_02g02170 [Encephalitozoon intestinalis]
MESDRLSESEKMIGMVESELLEEIKHKYKEIEESIEKTAAGLDKVNKDLQDKVKAIYKEAEEGKLMYPKI